jgi:DNA-binding response OmpR family regulator
MKRILFVDDDVDLLATMKTFLRRQGYEVAVTTTCSEGLEILRVFNPDLILLDINVGSEDGRLMCRQIKNEAEYKHIPIILISANEEELKTYSDFGADSFLGKPFDQAELAQALHTYL